MFGHQRMPLFIRHGVSPTTTSLSMKRSENSSDNFTLEGSQVVPPTDSLATGVARVELSQDGEELKYFINLEGLDLVEEPSQRTDPNDVTKIHFHFGAPGSNGPHVLNVFGLPSEDDGNLVVDYDAEVLRGKWDDRDAIDPTTGELFDQSADGTTKLLSDFVDQLLEGNLYIQVHTVQFPDPGEIRGQIPAAEVMVNEAVFSGTGDITGIVEMFQDVVDMGGVNNGNEIGSQGDGFREINWDGGAVPFNMPGNFFNNQNRPVNGLSRGVEFSTASDVSLFGVSNPVLPADPFFGDNEFDTINPTYPDQFTTFSSPRLFAPLDLNFMDVDFFEPGVFDDNGDPVPALVTGFGAIFTDVDLPESTKLEFFDRDGDLLFSQFVEPDPQGLSFLGVAFDQPVVSKVRITSGNVSLGRGLDDDPFSGVDVVVMDNFIYGEPLVA